jgi:hypothetical protein
MRLVGVRVSIAEIHLPAVGHSVVLGDFLGLPYSSKFGCVSTATARSGRPMIG